MNRMRATRVVTSLVLPLVVHAGCHVAIQHEVTRPSKVERIRQTSPPVAQPPTIVVDEQGRLRFVEPLTCATEERVTVQRGVERSSKPNIATFVIGVIGTAAGAIALTNALGSRDRAANPLTYVGAVGLGVGLPFAIGPWVGHRTTLEPLGDEPPFLRAGAVEPCGARPLAASRATLQLRGLEVHGAVDPEGTFAISPFSFVDAFETRAMASLDIAATVETPAGPRRIETLVEGGTLATKAAAFLASADFETAIEPMRMVPNLVAGTLRVSLTSQSGVPALRLVLPIANEGPGDSHALRGHVTASGMPAIDGRVLYLGRVPKGGAVTRELMIPLTTDAADALRNATIELAVELRDAHGTAPATPVRFRGAVLVDAPR